ncbi:MAG: BRO-N domain-containing protein, partial [Lactococcus garvieae]
MQAQAVRQFESELFGSLTTVVDEKGGLWFVGRQVAEKLGYAEHRSNLSYALNSHCPDRQQLSSISLDVRVQGVRSNASMISEADLYRLVMGSTLPNAQQFQDWVTREVLPSIREHGGYVVEQPSMADQRADADLMEEVNTRFQDFRSQMEAMIREVVPSVVASTLTAAVPAIVAAVKGAKNDQPELTPMPEGFTTLEELYSMTQGAISKDAFKSLLRGSNWTRSEYDKVLEDGRVVRLTCWAIHCNIRGEIINVNQLVDRVCREAR